MIPRKGNSKIGNDDMGWCLYKYHHFVENVFARLKHFRAIAIRYDMLGRNYRQTLIINPVVWLFCFLHFILQPFK